MNGLLDGFKLAFYTLFEALSARDMRVIGEICEGKLREAFNEGFENF